MRRIISFVLAVTLIAAGHTIAFAKDTPPVPTPAAPSAPTPPPAAAAAPVPDPNTITTLKMFKDKGADVNYLGRLYGLDGWLVSQDSAVEVVYTTPDGQASVVGLLYGPDGNLATAAQLQAAKEKGLTLPNTAATADKTAQTGAATAGETPGSAGERLWADVQNSTYITIGPKTAPVLYVFVDPRCHFCQNYWQTLSAQYLPQNAVQLRLIIVGILGPDSEHIAQQVLSAPDKGAAWTSVEAGNLGALPTDIAPDADAKLQANRAVMTKWGFNGTPYSVYRGKDGKVKIVYGVPSDVGQVIGDLAPGP